LTIYFDFRVGNADTSNYSLVSPAWRISLLRLAITVEGVVQGVGFRPFVYGLAMQLGLAGFVRNCGGRVEIEAEGTGENLDQFCEALTGRAPPLARVEKVVCSPQRVIGDSRFEIQPSEKIDQNSVNQIFISPDVATCDACLAEMFDPRDRRYLYPFINCTNCGPRLTIIKGAPYDRSRTTMAGFAMCAACRAEYENPSDRRFHAQPTCCPTCGPTLKLLDANGRQMAAVDPIQTIIAQLCAGKIAAIKGLGGYHLACDAANESAVQELRRRKHRDEKPFAVMVRDVHAARVFCEVSDCESKLLASSGQPIVLLRKRPVAATPASLRPQIDHESDAGVAATNRVGPLAETIAPKIRSLGIMLPYTPVHHLLMRELGPLVMTSGNCSDEPIAYADEDAVDRLKSIADVFLIHNRPIHVRCDDSVTRVVDEVEFPIRRSRGYAPQPIRLLTSIDSPTLAVGGQLKATFALASRDQAVISHHMGDLDHLQAQLAFERDVKLYEELFQIRPQLIAHDLHPDYVSTQYAQRRAQLEGIDLLPIQHHHAHMASCMAENNLDEPVIGVTFDGTGYGTNGTIWGGEFLVGDYRQFDRAAHLRYVGMPGADAAVHEPWRMAISYLADANCDDSPIMSRLDATSLRVVRQMLVKGVNTPMTSSAGRLFDAVAALIGIRDKASYEGQAAIEMEQLAEDSSAEGAYPFDLAGKSPLIIDTRPIIAAIVSERRRGTELADIARRFHWTVVEMVACVCKQISESTGISSVVLSGGVFLNALLIRETISRLNKSGLKVFRHRQVPPNDGGLCLGQLAIAAALIRNPVQSSNPERRCVSPSLAR
jgi:hydrogenase maturation protein HypF